MKKVNRVDLATGPRTRSRANKIADTRDKEAATGSVLEEVPPLPNFFQIMLKIITPS